jgi:hypothetical protein
MKSVCPGFVVSDSGGVSFGSDTAQFKTAKVRRKESFYGFSKHRLEMDDG